MQLRRNQLVAIEIVDHVQQDNKPDRFVLYGQVRRVTPTSVTIDSWHRPSLRRRYDPVNETRWTIVKAAIVAVSALTPTEIFRAEAEE